MDDEDDKNVQMRISIINVPDDLSPLKLRGYLRDEATDIQRISAKNCYAVIRLFLPDRIRFGYTQKKLDGLLEDIVGKFPSIYKIELVPVPRSLNAQQMEEETLAAQGHLQEMIEDLKRFEAGGKEPPSTIH